MDEFIDKVVQATEGIESFTSDITITGDGEGAQQMGTFKMEGTNETMLEPYSTHSVMKMLINQMSMDIESYTVDGVTYTSNPMLSGWIKTENEDTFLSKEIWIEMTLNHQESGMETTMNIHTVMNNYNTVEDIVVPAEVKEASESSMQMPGMGEMTPEMQEQMEKMGDDIEKQLEEMMKNMPQGETN